MNPIKLSSEDGKIVIWKCSEGNHYFRDTPGSDNPKIGKELAEKCCTPGTCSYCGEPTKPVKGGVGRQFHSACQDAQYLDNALEIPVEEVEHGYFWDEKFFEELGEVMEYIFDDRWLDLDKKMPTFEDLPKFIHTALSYDYSYPSTEDWIENIYHELPDDADPDQMFSGLKELDDAIDKFNEDNAGVMAFMENHQQKVRLPWEAYFKEEAHQWLT